MMSSHLAFSRLGHLDQMYHIFAYLKKQASSDMVFDPSQVEFDQSAFLRQAWSRSTYTNDGANLQEELPPSHVVQDLPCSRTARAITLVTR
ncbi:hypothetical protein ACHAWF_010333 [Thalassiosira exigua]